MLSITYYTKTHSPVTPLLLNPLHRCLNGFVQMRALSGELVIYPLIFLELTRKGSSKMFLNAAKFSIL